MTLDQLTGSRRIPTFDRLWERHKNPWSWLVRPPFGALYLYGAWRQSLALLLLATLALSTSWFWFPRPKRVSPNIDRFIEIERRFVTPPYTFEKLAGALLVLLFLIGVTGALWRGSIALGLWVFAGGALFKSIWSVAVAGRAGYPAAWIGLVSALLSGLLALYCAA